MNPLLLEGLFKLATEAIKAVPALRAEYAAIKAAGSATPADLAAIQAQVDAMDAARLLSWAEADDALDRAAARPGP